MNFLDELFKRTSNTIDSIKRTMATKDDMKKILNAIYKLINKSENNDRLESLITYWLDIIEPKIENHEKRISLLESVVVK